jgi:hypothetical protein
MAPEVVVTQALEGLDGLALRKKQTSALVDPTGGVRVTPGETVKVTV